MFDFTTYSEVVWIVKIYHTLIITSVGFIQMSFIELIYWTLGLSLVGLFYRIFN